MHLRKLTNNDMIALLKMYVKMCRAIEPDCTEFRGIFTAMQDITTHSTYVAFGMFDKKNKLVGFSAGYASEQKTFYFSAICVIIKTGTRKLIDFSFEQIKELGYTSWEADATNDNITSVLQNKYNASVKSTKFTKEL